VRRRVWAQIRMLDLRTAEELGCEPTIVEGTYDTSLPLDIPDEILSQLEPTTSAEGQLTELNRDGLSFNVNPGSARPQDSPKGYGHLQRDAQEQEMLEPRRRLSSRDHVSSSEQDPKCVEYHQQKHVFSEMTFSLIRYETVGLFSRLLSPKYRQKPFSPCDGSIKIYGNKAENILLGGTAFKPTSEEKTLWIDGLERKFENIYRFHELNMNEPIQKLTVNVARLLVAKARFIVKHQQWKATQGVSSEEEVDERTRYFAIQVPLVSSRNGLIRSRLFQNATAIVEQMVSLVEDKANSRWTWYVNTYTDYYAFAFLLFNLAGAHSQPEPSARAWRAIDRLTQNHDGDPPTGHGVLSRHATWYPFRRLLALARARENERAVSNEGSCNTVLPDPTCDASNRAEDGFYAEMLSQLDVPPKHDIEMADLSWLDQMTDNTMVYGSFSPWGNFH